MTRLGTLGTGAALTAAGGYSLAPIVPAASLLPTLVVAVVVPTALVAAFQARYAGLLSAVALWPVLGTATAFAIGVPGGLLTDALDAPRTLLTGSLPITATSGLVLWLFSVVWWAAYWTARAAGQALGLLPPTLLLAAGSAASVSAPGDRAPLAVVFTALAALLLALRTSGGHLVRVAGAIVIGVLAVPIAGLLPARAHPVDPRDAVRAPQHTRQLLSPLAEADLWAAGPAEPLFRVRSAEAPPLRLTILDGYDGQEWTSSATYTAGGPTLPMPSSARGTHQVTTDIELENLNTPWLPAPDRPVTLTGVPAFVDRADGLLAAPAGRPSRGLRYRVVSWVPELSERSAGQATPATGPGYAPYLAVPRDLPAAIARAAEQIAGQAESPYRQLLLLQNALHDGYKYQARATPGRTAGHLAFFYQISRVGTADQFAATFAMMARHLGFPTRLAIGFGGRHPTGDGWSQVLSTDVTVWPEVALRGLGWVPFYPVPAAGGGPAGAGAEPVSRAMLDHRLSAARPTPAPVRVAPAAARPASAHSSGRRLWPYALLCLVLPAVAYPVCVPLARLVAGRRARSGPPAAQIAAAWRMSVTELLRLGHPGLAALTPDETAAYAGTRLGTGAGRTMAGLATTLADTVYSPRSPGRADAEQAWIAARKVSADVGTAIGHRGRVRRALEFPPSARPWRDRT